MTSVKRCIVDITGCLVTGIQDSNELRIRLELLDHLRSRPKGGLLRAGRVNKASANCAGDAMTVPRFGQVIKTKSCTTVRAAGQHLRAPRGINALRCDQSWPPDVRPACEYYAPRKPRILAKPPYHPRDRDPGRTGRSAIQSVAKR